MDPVVPPSVAAVVLAGGRSRRFGSDKLAADLDGRPLLERSLDGLPADWTVILVGPVRPLSRPARFVREHPTGGGPAAALVAGIRAARDAGATIVVTLPGDAPGGGTAAALLVERLVSGPGEALVAVDHSGRDQPLQLVLRGSRLDLVAEAGDHTGDRARALLDLLPGLDRLPLAPALTADVDLRADADQWRPG